ncbi:MAG: pyridoxal-5'-phosphate-dependent protein [Oceanospirillum sp.]|nr:pyridoxal-5'-phosphate-dependent protein [Oceanospirillum sp.]
MSGLALLGGDSYIGEHSFKRYNSIGEEEKQAVVEVMEGGVLSQFLGCWHDDFYGGPKVRQFEQDCEQYFDVKRAVTVNSWTSGLICALGAIGLEPGDEVIVPTWTMCASATAILHWNAIPVFADIDPYTFNLDPESVRKNISPKTKAIMSVDIFGLSADMQALRAIADEHQLKIVSDSAQAPGGKYDGQYAGTLADIGGFSLNYHKHIHTGEGGVLVTQDDELAEKMCLIRNHAEAVVEAKGCDDLANMVGYNFRMGELEAAIGIEQLKKLDVLVERRRQLAQQLTQGLQGLSGLQLPARESESEHSFYVYPMVLAVDELMIPRSKIVSALAAEGVDFVAQGYQNVHLQPMYQQKIAFGRQGFPWSAEFCQREVDYSKGICPVAETLHDHSFIYIPMCLYDFTDQDIELIVGAFNKVWAALDQLRDK